MLRALSLSLLLALCLQACSTSLTVRAPVCQPVTIPPDLLKPCPGAEALKDGKFSSLYLQSLADSLGPWKVCINRHHDLVLALQFQEKALSECQRAVQQSQSQDQSTKWFWQK